ncbi:hypothetical protein [Nonomuraea jiangxiensis]|uniref:Uncharacterized protein n=1 Tax=Nonomuraea jiangxiensis TaxID=633440 RepID=A0A1G7YD97_9ACTN|nr:hypothetical protein [Nonomuraea jiangxiensis]SDG94315.1 hypothetical protein SAMN05421869_10181 [Nonomuraea jiangxiensis]
MKRLVLAWAVTAVAATGAAVAVLGLLGGGLIGSSGHVLHPAEVRAALTTATSLTSPSAVPPTEDPLSSSPPSATPPAAESQGGLIRSLGGTVVASCDGDLVTLRSWSPAQGYSVDDHVEAGPAHRAKVEFEPDEGEDVELEIACTAGRPVLLRRH